MQSRWWAFGLGAVVIWWVWSGREVSHPPGVVVRDTPEQSAVEQGDRPWSVGDYTLTPLAKFRVRARVLGSERYWFDAGASLSPIDFALAWGRMSDSMVLSQLNISQGFRFYRYSWSNEPPIPAGEIISSSSNMHLIPSSGEIKSQLTRVRVGQIVTLAGKLVRADKPDGWHWVSSLTRNDTGAGACELVWVEQVDAE